MDVILNPAQKKEKQSVEKLCGFLSEAYSAVLKQSHSKALDPFASALALTEKIGNDKGEPSTANFLHNVVYADYALALYIDYLNGQAVEATTEKMVTEEDNEGDGKGEDQDTEEDGKGSKEENDGEKSIEEGEDDTKDKNEQDDATSGSNLEQAKEFFILAKQFFEQYTVNSEVSYWNTRLNHLTVCQVCKYIAEIAFLQGNVEEALCAVRLAATRAQEHLQDMPVFLFGLIFDCLLYMIASPARKLEQGALATASVARGLLRDLPSSDDLKLAALQKDFKQCEREIEIILRDKDGNMSDDFISGTLNNMLLTKDKRLFQKWNVSQKSAETEKTSEDDDMEGEDSETVSKEPTTDSVVVKNVSPPVRPNPVNMIQHLVRRKRKDPEVSEVSTQNTDVVTLSDESKMESPAKKIKN